jgi:hypothetical protein
MVIVVVRFDGMGGLGKVHRAPSGECSFVLERRNYLLSGGVVFCGF